MKKEIQPLNEDIGERLKNLRISKGLSQVRFIAELAEKQKFTIKKSTYSRYEYGETPIPVSSLKVFCDYFGVTTDYLINGTEKEKISPDKEITKILNLFTADEKKTICNFMANIANCMEEN